MTDNIYKPPEADLALESESGSSRFYVVSKRKLVILFVATLGMYIFYWFFANWRNYRVFTGEKILPIPRSIFYIFFTHSLFDEVTNNLKSNHVDYDWSPKLLANLYVIIAIVGYAFDWLSFVEIGSPVTDVLSIATMLLMLVIMLKAQEAINFSHGDSAGSSNNVFTVYNYIFIGLGVLLWIVVLTGLMAIFGYLPVEQ